MIKQYPAKELQSLENKKKSHVNDREKARAKLLYNHLKPSKNHSIIVHLPLKTIQIPF